MSVGVPGALTAPIDILRHAHIPLGGLLIAAGLGMVLYATVRWLRRRPQTEGAGTVPVRIVDAEAPPPDARPARLLYAESERSILVTGAGGRRVPPLPRARSFVVALIVTFTAVASLLLLLYGTLFGSYERWVAAVGSLVYWPMAWPGGSTVVSGPLVVPDYIFPMYLSAIAAFALASGLLTNRQGFSRARRMLALSVVVVYLLTESCLDALFLTVPEVTLWNFALIVRTFTGGFFVALLVFCVTYLPTPQRIDFRGDRDRRALALFYGIALISVVSAVGTLVLVNAVLQLNQILVGGALLLPVPLLILVLFVTISRPLYGRRVRRRPLPSVQEFHPSVSILMPAYNEEQWIELAIQAADRSARSYPGSVEIVVGNDGSTDRTVELARRAIARLEHSTGVVVDLPHGEKSSALNGALAVATGDIVIRCDGDTTISETYGFAAMIPHFADPEVGEVQGAIHPRQREGWTRKMRGLEVAWTHYFIRPAGMATRSAEVIDGLFSAFRRNDLVRIGGWVPWNGEDSEISIRVQRLGYLLRIEFGALALEDVPHNYDALRRQRVRWGRGILMANGQHYPALFGPTPEFGGLAILVWFAILVHSVVRGLVYLFLLLLIVVLGVPALVDTALLLAVAIGIRAGPLGYFLYRMRRLDLLPWIPLYSVFGGIKQAFRFEAYATLGPKALQEYS